ncbi:MAG: T9SS type A sorting domain-containing protein, partial [Chitinispirillia bacterium]|nr:T9SS type A sorting domain-containing protein [Chitinispirillia bacterium]
MYRFKAGVFCVILSAFAASVLAVDLDTAFVPFLVNADARVTAANGEIVIFIDTEADKEAILRLPLAKTLGVTRRSQNANNTPVITGSHNGKISLNLPGQNYKTAELTLYTVNGKQIMRTKADASRAVNNIARPNLASGVYLLSVKGANGQSFSSRLTHRGGSFNISIAFGNESFLTSSPVAVSAAAPGSNDWTITVSAEGYIDSSYTLGVAAVDNPVQNITLKSSGGECGADGHGHFNPNIDYGCFTDTRDNQSYRTVTIGTQMWFAQNLNFETGDSWCYLNSPDSCAKYGRLYTWSAAMGLPSSCNS